MKRYSSDLLRVVRKSDNKTHYYVMGCDHKWQRISKEAYWHRWHIADGASNLLTKGDKTHWRHYTTVLYEYGREE